MTKASRPVQRETFSNVRVRGKNRPLVIEIHATYITIRPKGTRKAFLVTLDQIYTLGARNEAEKARRERAAKRA